MVKTALQTPRTVKNLTNNAIRAERALLNEGKTAIKEATTSKVAKKGGRNRFRPDSEATGPHTTFRRDPNTGSISHYETFAPQTNPRNPNPWESLKRYDGPGGIDDRHYNKILKNYIETPHVHDPYTSGGIRYPEKWEIPKR